MLKYVLAISALLVAGLPGQRALAADAAQMEQNKKTVMALDEATLNKKDFDEASNSRAALHAAQPHCQRRSRRPQGVHQFPEGKIPQQPQRNQTVFADGDYVIVHVHAVREPGTRGLAIFDLFKLENGKVVEHWDTVQPIPETAQNNNTMF